MALITPMVKWIVYPSMMREARRRWARAFPGAGEQVLADADRQKIS
jgi:hypothetical protein